MRIKCSVNKKVEDYVKEHWPEKKVICNYTNDSSRMRDENRYIQISIPIKDPYLHYEIINNHIELHFEYSDSKGEGVTVPANQELVDYLERVTETDNNYEWSYWGECSVRCVQLGCINEGDMLDKLKTILHKLLTFDTLSGDKVCASRVQRTCSLPRRSQTSQTCLQNYTVIPELF